MDMKALRRIVLSRWWVIVLAVVLALVISDRLADYRADALPEAEAITSVTFFEDPTTLERDEFEGFLETQFALAQTVNSDIVNETPGAFIPWPLAVIDLELNQNRIEFIGRGATEQEATEIVETMRGRFLDTSSIGAGRDQVSRELQELVDEIETLRDEVAAAQSPPELTDDQRAQQSRRETIVAEIGALRGHYGNLTVEWLNPVDRSGEAVKAEIDRTLARIQALEAELAAIPTLPDPTVEQAGDLELLLDQLRLENLQQRWDALYQSERALAALASDGPVATRPVTVEVPSQTSNTMLAVFGALVVAIAALVAYERARGVVWSPNDIDEQPLVFLEMAPRDLALFDRPSELPWYLGAAKGRRKSTVQNLRGALEEYKDAVVAIQGTGVHQVDIREMSADLAVAAAVSGRSVLLLDTAFNRPTGLVEFSEAGSTLGALLADDADQVDTFASLKEALARQGEVSSGLVVVAAGEIDADPADILSRSRFQALLQVAQEMFDLILISGVDVDNPASHVVANRADGVIILGAVGQTVNETMETAERDLVNRRAELTGGVLLLRRRSKPVRWLAHKFRRTLYSIMDRIQERRGADGASG